MYGALGVLVLIGAIVIGVSASAVSDSDKSRSNIKAKEDREEKLARQSSVETIKAILPGLIRYADLLEGKIKVPVADHKKEAEALYALWAVAHTRGAKIQARNGFSSEGRGWDRFSDLLQTDSQVMGAIFSKIKV
jgi:hypothetical protein